MNRAQVSKSEFKAKALEFLRKVEATGESIIVTDHGKPSVEVKPYRSVKREPLQMLRGTVIEYVDPTEPVGNGDWEALG